MNLYEQDYTIILTEEEKEAYEKEKAYESIPTVKNNRGFPRFSHPKKAHAPILHLSFGISIP